ncbi:MAG: ral transcriptional co-repressor, acts together with Tup1p, glucose repression mediator protein [Patescibacteria group bacterium]|nr:ral transcriptional co-repressor, acts together with Tup1p, glucose repression mediator protein [Patescibacteria group bacterium]
MFKTITKKFQEWRGATGVTSDSFMMTVLMIMVTLGPVFFIPVLGMSAIASKGYFFAILGLVLLLGIGVSILRRGEIRITKNWIFRILGILLAIELLGAILSPAFGMSFLGYGFETNSWMFLLIFSVTCLAAYRTIRSYERIGIVYGGIALGTIVLALVHIARFFVGATHLTFGVLGTSTSSLVGSWSDFGIVLGFLVLFSVITLELGGLRKGIKAFLIAILVLACACLAFMNLQVVWIIIGFMSLATALYIFTLAFWDSEAKAYRKHRSVPWYALAVVIVSIVCLFFGSALNTLAGRHQSIVSNDIRLSQSATARAGVQAIAHNPITGYGPNTFGNVWNLAKPPAVSGTAFAGSTFSYGSGFITTQLATNGVLGIIGWIALLVAILFLIVKSLAKGFESSLERYIVTLLSASIIFLLVAGFFLITGSYILILLAVLVGALIGIRSDNDPKAETVRSFMSDPRASFFGILGVTILIIAIIFAGYLELRKVIGAVHAVRGSNYEAAGNLDMSITQFSLAAAYAPHDVYYRELSALTIARVNQLSSSVTQANKEQVTKQAQSVLGTALAQAQAATRVNPADYQNWIAVGNVYRTLVSLGITDAAAQAKTAYGEAQKRDPHDPAIYLALAQLALAQNDTDGANALIAQSIDYYPTTGAYILRAQIQVSKQDYAGAITSMTAALTLDPYNATTAYQLGLLFYHQADYAHAIAAFKQAILSNRSFGLAYGYLGVSYEKSGDQTDADAVYAYMRKQSDQSDALISQIKGTDATPAPTVQEPANLTPTGTKAPAKTVAPAAKKK